MGGLGTRGIEVQDSAGPSRTTLSSSRCILGHAGAGQHCRCRGLLAASAESIVVRFMRGNECADRQMKEGSA